jgi:hypothetical protein
MPKRFPEEGSPMSAAEAEGAEPEVYPLARLSALASEINTETAAAIRHDRP